MRRLAISVLMIFLVGSHLQAQATRPAAPIIELRGDGAALGEAHGKALGESIRELEDGFFARAMDADTHKIMAAGAMGFAPLLRPEHLAEIKSLAGASHLDE
jgi:hypothetical protein